MVVIDTKFNLLQNLVGKKFTEKELVEILFDMGFELEEKVGDDIKIELTPERSDCISTYGLARAIRAYLGIKTGLPKYAVERMISTCKVDSSLKQVLVPVNPEEKAPWQYVVCAVVKGLEFDDDRIKEVIRVQEKLHQTYLRKRRKGGIGIYPLDKIKMPITFTAMAKDKIKFRPLEANKVMTGSEILMKHSAGREYSYLLEGNKNYPVFIDANTNILSMPPIINSHDTGKVDETTKDIFIECTGVELEPLLVTLNILTTMFADMGGKVHGFDMLYSGKKIKTPDFTTRKRTINLEEIDQLLGIKFSAKDAKKLLEKMMHSANLKGSKLEVESPSFRVDMWHAVDIIDDIGRAYGYNNMKPRFPNVNTIGNIFPETKIKDDMADVLAGLGLVEIFTEALTNEDDQYSKMNTRSVPYIKIPHAVEPSLNMVRTWLTPCLFRSLNFNRSNRYPQEIFEIADVVIPDKKADVKSKNVTKLSMLIADLTANFTRAKQVLQALSESMEVQLEVKAKDYDWFVSGRSGAITLNGKEVGYIGEFHPQVILNWGLEVPVVGFEIDLSFL